MSDYPDEKSRVIIETENTIDKLTNEFSISPAYSLIEINNYCSKQLALLYESQGQKIPKELEKYIISTNPKILKDQEKLITEQHLMLNTSGSA